MSSDFQEQEAVRYFYGELSETEQAAVEEKFFTDAEFSEWLDEVETDLIDSYARGEMSATEKRKFEEKFLVSERRRERVRAASAILKLEKENAAQTVVASSSATKISFWESLKEFFNFSQYGLAYAAGLVLILFLLGGILFLRQPQNEIVQKGNENINVAPTRPATPEISPAPTANAAPSISNENANFTNAAPQKSATPKPSETPTPAPTRPAQAPQPVVAFFSLFPSVRSGGDAQKLVLKKDARTVQMRLARESGEEFARYRAELRDAGGKLIFSQNLSNRKTLISTFPAGILRQGTYELTLKGARAGEDFQDLSFYNFSIEKK
jgi:hypothetical protein